MPQQWNYISQKSPKINQKSKIHEVFWVGHVEGIDVLFDVETSSTIMPGEVVGITPWLLFAEIVGGFAEREVGDEPIEAGFVPGAGLEGIEELLLAVVGEIVPKVARGSEEVG